MSAKNKLRGNALENQVVKAFTDRGIEAKRAWGSNGEAMGQHAEVDVLVPRQIKNIGYIEEIKIQCKKKKKLPDWIGLSEHVDVAVISEDYGKRYLIIELNSFISKYL